MLSNVAAEKGTLPSATRASGRAGDDSFLNAYTRARELGAIVVADTVRDVANQELSTHEEIGKARLQMQADMWHSGRYNPQFADKPNQTQVNVAVGVVLPEAERLKLLERRSGAIGQPGQKRNFYGATASAVTQSAMQSFGSRSVSSRDGYPGRERKCNWQAEKNEGS